MTWDYLDVDQYSLDHDGTRWVLHKRPTLDDRGRRKGGASWYLRVARPAGLTETQLSMGAHLTPAKTKAEHLIKANGPHVLTLLSKEPAE